MCLVSLRALQERAVRPVGGNPEVPYNARVITATNRDLEAAVRAKRFREDLYYRIAVVNVEVPTLRARGDDVPVLAQHFVTRSDIGCGSTTAVLVPILDALGVPLTTGGDAAASTDDLSGPGEHLPHLLRQLLALSDLVASATEGVDMLPG